MSNPKNSSRNVLWTVLEILKHLKKLVGVTHSFISSKKKDICGLIGKYLSLFCTFIYFKRIAGVFIPFGNGPRQCLGMRYAVADIKAALCTLIRKYDFALESPPSKPSQPLGRLFFLMDSAVLNIKSLQ